MTVVSYAPEYLAHNSTIELTEPLPERITLENVSEVAERILRMLLGKSFTYVVAYKNSKQLPVVKTGQRLGSRSLPTLALPVSVHHNPAGKYAVLHINGTHGDWSLRIPSRIAFVRFESGKVTITHQLTGGKQVHTVFAVEK